MSASTKVTLFCLQLLLLQISDGTSRFRYTNRASRVHHQPNLLSAELRQRDCNFNICESDTNYPEDEVRRIVNQHESFHSFLKGKVIEPVPNGISIFSRSGEGTPQTFCKTTDITAAPKLMMDIDKKERHIVNVQNYSQILRYQTCDHDDGEECFKETILDMKTKCVQKFNNIKLVTVDVNYGILEYRTFRIPTTCVCTYMRNFA